MLCRVSPCHRKWTIGNNCFVSTYDLIVNVLNGMLIYYTLVRNLVVLYIDDTIGFTIRRVSEMVPW